MSAKKNNKPTRLIYVGPNLSRGRLVKYQVFIGGLPAHLRREFEEHPQLKALFVPVLDLPKAIKEAQTLGTPLNKYYEEIKEI